MKSACLLLITGFSALSLASAQNVAMTSGGVAVATSSNGQLLTRLGNQELFLNPPQGISGFADVSIDADNENLVFALSVSPPRVCSYSLNRLGVPSLTLMNCVGSTFATAPFCGISARGGTLAISGGTGGVTVFDYDADTGVLQASPRFENERLNVIGNPDVLMISPNRAAFSSDIGGSPRFGSIVADISGASLIPVGQFLVVNSSNFANTVRPSNFPFVNALFRQSWLYTANGAMTVQNIDIPGGEIVEIQLPSPSFQAVTVSVNEEQNKVVFGGLLASGQSVIYSFDIIDGETVVLSGTMEVGGRITSVARGTCNVISYVVQGGSTIESFFMEEMTMPFNN